MRRSQPGRDQHPDAWAPILAAALHGDVVLLYSSHDVDHSNAVVLRDYLNERLDHRAGDASHGRRDRDS